jgi:threonine synthase
MSFLECGSCGSKFNAFPPKCLCEKCGGLLEYKYDHETLKRARFVGRFSFWRYRKFMPEVRTAVSMREGGTPLYDAQRVSKTIGLRKFYFKDETRNPTNSFRDRCAALLISNALDLGFKSVVCATNGNLGASIAAYCARFGLTCYIVVPKSVDVGKLAQMIVYDAMIEEYGGIVDEALEKAEKVCRETGWYQGSVELNPLALEALKTIAYEVFEQVGVPDWFIVPVGSGGTLYAVWKGFRELEEIGKINVLPRMVGVQAEGCSPVVDAFLQKAQKPILREKPSTHALAILVRNPMYGSLALDAIRKSGGLALAVSDEEIFLAEREIARLEGIFAEPASAATYAAAKKLVDQGLISGADKVVCLITGSGLKATDVLQALTKRKKMAVIGLELSTKERILRILSEKDTYGYELWKELGKIMTRAAIYQHLNELLRKGLVISYEKDGRKFFRITKLGEEVLKALETVKILM